MPSKKQTVIALASEEIRATMSSPSRYMDFLDTAAQNYKYHYREQVLIHAQKPDATACADIETWNRLGRWVNKGTKGIALLADRPPVSLRYVFDISDTNSRVGREVSLWELKPRYETSVMESLENAYGALNAGGFFPNVAMAVAERMVEDNLPDYLELLKEQTAGSLLEELDEDSLRQWLREPLQASVGYMILARCGYAPRDFYGAEDFAHIMDFDTEETASVLGDAASRMAEGVLREIATTVRSLQKAERAENRTFAEPAKEKYNDAGTKNTERSKEHGTDLQAGRRLSDSRLGSAGEPEGGQVRDAAADLPAGAPQPDLHGDAVQWQTEPASGGNRPAGQRDAGSPDLPDEERAGRDREAEGRESAPVGSEDEQHPQRSGGDRPERAGLQVAFPTVGEQQENILQAEAEQASAFAISQEDIDAILTRGSGISQTEQEEPSGEEADQHPISVVEKGEVVTYPNAEAMMEEKPLSAPPMLPKRKAAPNILHPEITNRRNHRILGDDLGVGTPSERYSRNVMAIRLLKKLEAEGRLATELEQDILADYVGWGGLADCFDERNSHYSELKDLLTEEEYAAARESTLTAFFTPPVVIKAMYQALANMGFQTGNILEPSCGVGNFMGLLPESMSSSKMYGIELDSVSGRIAQQLYQHNSIAVQGFEKTDLPDSFFDAAIGNVPFGQFKVPDRRYDKHNFLIHDYFFARTLDKVRPGGVIAFITSKGTMDKENPSVRKYIAQRANLIAAIRLPNNTFKEAAGTEVTSDILILQKRESLIDMEPDWVHLGVDANGIKMNQYFVDHPDMIMGEMQMVSGPYGPESACIPYAGQELSDLLADAVAGIHGQITEYDVQDVSDDEEDHSIPADPTVRNFSFALVDGKVYFRENSRMNPVELTVTADSRVKGMIAIRDCVRQLIEYQTEDYPDSMIEAEQEKLNALYDEFEKKYGRINSRANNSAFRDDSSYYLLTSLEVTDDEGKFIRKADMFTKRTIRKKVIVTTVDTASEALALSLAEKAGIDMPYMQSLTGKTEEQLAEDLRGVIFLNPEHISENDSHPKYLPADEYLSGNVREKLALARRTAELYPEDYAPNVTALERVQPQDLTASEISVRLGATWLPEDVAADFMFEQLSTPRYARWNIKVHYSPITGEWNIEGKNYDRGNVKANSTYGTERINAYKIMEETLNLRDVRIFDYLEDGYGKKVAVLNKKETAIAQGKQELLKQAFQDWIWSDPERRARLTTLYNEKFNSNRPREYDGSHLNFVGMNPEIRLRPHQVNAVAHILYGGNTLLAHVVGAGKTYEMTAAAMESKRLGLCQKSLFVVPNHLTEQWASEFLQLYPAANILVATRKDFEAKNRKRFCSRIATGDYDAVIIGHSQFEKIPISIQRQQALLQQQLDEIMDGIADLRRNRGDRFSIKQMEKSKKSIQAKLDKLNDQTRKDDVVTFEQLGIDRIFVDEAHFYKNLAAFSKMRNVGGISQTEAMKSSDLYMKCRYLDELTGGRGVIFATGTPISNSMVEMYTMQKYLQYDALRRNGLLHFDAWASTFGETVTAIELAPEGKPTEDVDELILKLMK